MSLSGLFIPNRTKCYNRLVPVEVSTKDRMIHAALELFHRRGLNATSIDQILAASGTGKSQFSHYFGSKDGLVRAVIKHLAEVIRSGQAPTGYDVCNWDDLEGWFQKYIDFQKSVACEMSCPLATIGNDLSNDQELLRQDVRIFIQWSRDKISRFFAERRAAGELVAQADPDALADLCISVMQGGMLLTKMKRETDVFVNAAQQVLTYIRMLRTT